MSPKWLIPLVGLMLVAGPAVAGENADDYRDIIAQPTRDGEPAENSWVATMDELARDYPAVARAVESPNRLVDVQDNEQESTRAFFDRMHENAHGALEVAGEQYTIAVAMASSSEGGGLPPASEGSGDGSGQANDVRTAVPASGVLALAGAAGAAVVIARRRG